MKHLRWIVALVASLTTPCQPFNTNIHSPISTPNGGGKVAYTLRLSVISSRLRTHHRVMPSRSRLYLFDSMMKKQDTQIDGQKSCLNCIPAEELDFLRNFGTQEQEDTPPLPHSFDLSTTPSNGDEAATTRLVVRYLEDEDIAKVLPELVREFGAFMPPPSQIPDPGDELSSTIENYLFSMTVLIGLTQRVVRRQKGYSPSNPACPDHNVICLVEQTPNGIHPSEHIVGMAELSWQPPDPNGTAPPFVLPYFVKGLISRFFSTSRGDGTAPLAPVGYVSNVLVWKTRRGRGYARVLMAALEGIAKVWGCEDVRLHVDANDSSGRIARGLYWDLGYEGVPDRGTSKDKQLGYEWMGPSMANQGLYLVDGVPLLYLRKSLKD